MPRVVVVVVVVVIEEHFYRTPSGLESARTHAMPVSLAWPYY